MPAALHQDVRAQLELLSQMIEDISGELALEPLLARIVERACRLTGADDGVIGLYEPERDAIRTAASYRIPQRELRGVLPRGHGLTGRVLELDAPLRCRYGDLPHPTRASAMDMDMIGMPIRAQGRLVGVFGIGVHAPRRLEEGVEELLDLFARHAAIAIVNARRYSGEQRRAARFAMIARVAAIGASGPDLDSLLQRTADAVHETLEYPNVDIPLLDPDDPQTLVIRIRGGDYKRLIRHEDRIPVARGIMGAAVREKRPQLVNDVAGDPRYVVPPGVTPPLAELALPILHGDTVLGVLNVEGDRVFDELDVVSLGIVAEHLGLAITNIRLFELSKQAALLEERRRLARDLHDNVTQIVSSMGLITQSLRGAWERDPAEAARRAERLGELARLACAELREMLRELAPGAATPGGPVGSAPTLPQRLHERLPQLLHPMVPPHVRLALDLAGLPTQAAVHDEAIVRICQEAVSNAVRHAAPARIQVSFAVEDGYLRLRVDDDGSGMARRPRRGMGLDNMCQRLHELGGTLQIGRRRPRGTSIVARLPLQAPEKRDP